MAPLNEKPRRLFHIRHKRPLGETTRGKTACNRLRHLDIFMMLYDPFLITDRSESVVIDLGYGAEPFTTLEMAQRLRRLNPQLNVIGVEIEPDRVERAKPYIDELTDFRLGGFDIPLLRHERVRLIRAFNVLRQYDESAVAESHTIMGHYLLPGGLLLEGTSDPFGRVTVANLLRKPLSAPSDEQLIPEALLFSINLQTGFDISLVQAVLPKNYIHRMIPGEPIHAFFEDWKRAVRETASSKIWGNRYWFIESCRRLRAMGPPHLLSEKSIGKRIPDHLFIVI